MPSTIVEQKKKCFKKLQQIPYQVYTKWKPQSTNTVQRYSRYPAKKNLDDVSVKIKLCVETWTCQLWSSITLRQLVLVKTPIEFILPLSYFFTWRCLSCERRSERSERRVWRIKTPHGTGDMFGNSRKAAVSSVIRQEFIASYCFDVLFVNGGSYLRFLSQYFLPLFSTLPKKKNFEQDRKHEYNSSQVRRMLVHSLPLSLIGRDNRGP